MECLGLKLLPKVISPTFNEVATLNDMLSESLRQCWSIEFLAKLHQVLLNYLFHRNVYQPLRIPFICSTSLATWKQTTSSPSPTVCPVRILLTKNHDVLSDPCICDLQLFLPSIFQGSAGSGNHLQVTLSFLAVSPSSLMVPPLLSHAVCFQ